MAEAALIEADVSLYLLSETRIARLEKRLGFAVFPRTNEFVKIVNRGVGDYFAFQVTQVTHREEGIPDLWLRVRTKIDGVSRDSLVPDKEFDAYVQSYVVEGWKLASCVVRMHFPSDAE